MTEITPSEIKMIYIQIILMAIIGVFLFFYAQQPVSQSYSITGTATSQNTSVSSTDAGWLEGLMTPDAGLGGYLPTGTIEIIIVSSIILIPLTIMNAFTVIRYAKDLGTQWI